MSGDTLLMLSWLQKVHLIPIDPRLPDEALEQSGLQKFMVIQVQIHYRLRGAS